MELATSGGNAVVYPAPPVGCPVAIALKVVLLMPFNAIAIPATVGFVSYFAYSMK